MPTGTFLVVQGLVLCALNAGGLDSILGQETRPHMLQLKIPCATPKTQHSQINIFKNKDKHWKAYWPEPLPHGG